MVLDVVWTGERPKGGFPGFLLECVNGMLAKTGNSAVGAQWWLLPLSMHSW